MKIYLLKNLENYTGDVMKQQAYYSKDEAEEKLNRRKGKGKGFWVMEEVFVNGAPNKKSPNSKRYDLEQRKVKALEKIQQHAKTVVDAFLNGVITAEELIALKETK